VTPVARILHIEDDPTNRLLVRKLLAQPGYDAVDGLDRIKKALKERPISCSSTSPFRDSTATK
jgi:hypothetical protein